jgi:hypothetical protein
VNPVGAEAQVGPTRWDYAIAGLAGFLLLGVPTGIVSAAGRVLTDPGSESRSRQAAERRATGRPAGDG